MESHIILIVILFGGLTVAQKSYRSDYIYNNRTDAFYKLHTEPLASRFAWSVCKAEGARPMFMSSEGDVAQVHEMLKPFPDLEDQVLVDEHSLQKPGEETGVIDLDVYDGPILWAQCVAITKNGNLEMVPCYLNLPFLCKVEATDAPYDSRCGVFGEHYKYFENVGSCYKISEIQYSWNQAYADCDAQGAHLVVINSDLEHRVIHNMTRPIIGQSVFFAGFRAQQTMDGSPRTFKTIYGQTLKEAGFDQWSSNEPNNALGKEDCGSIFQADGNYNDLDCYALYQYICEKEVRSN